VVLEFLFAVGTWWWKENKSETVTESSKALFNYGVRSVLRKQYKSYELGIKANCIQITQWQNSFNNADKRSIPLQ
jgi:hypothetical protein